MIEFSGTLEELELKELKTFGRMAETRAVWLRAKIAKHQERFDKWGGESDADWIRVYTTRLRIHGYEV
jgi:hypothetical protein